MHARSTSVALLTSTCVLLCTVLSGCARTDAAIDEQAAARESCKVFNTQTPYCKKLLKMPAGKQPPALDERYFICKVQPVLTKSCAMLRCHGDGGRYMRVFARNRLRYGGTESERNTALRPDELHMNYLAASAMVHPNDPEHSLLLLKPLDQSAGGYFHRGATIFNDGDVYLDRDETDYKTLESWVNGASWEDDPACKARFAAADGGLDGGP